MKIYADQIRAYVPSKYYVLGTDGYGYSDTREHLRDYFEVDAKHIAYTAIKALVDEGKIPMKQLVGAIKILGIHTA
jgi:pyruvate dehydrogenase E1 component